MIKVLHNLLPQISFWEWVDCKSSKYGRIFSVIDFTNLFELVIWAFCIFIFNKAFYTSFKACRIPYKRGFLLFPDSIGTSLALCPTVIYLRFSFLLIYSASLLEVLAMRQCCLWAFPHFHTFSGKEFKVCILKKTLKLKK